jgi:hypothetical protein
MISFRLLRFDFYLRKFTRLTQSKDKQNEGSHYRIDWGSILTIRKTALSALSQCASASGLIAKEPLIKETKAERVRA